MKLEQNDLSMMFSSTEISDVFFTEYLSQASGDAVKVYLYILFLSKYGKPLSMKMVINLFEKYRVMARIEKECTPKDLKNGFGRYAEEVVRERC